MCKPGNTEGTRKKTRVLIIGAGPGGLLAAILLLRRNASSSDNIAEKPIYEVTLVDPGVDYGKLDSDGLKRKRSWMIGLSCHGLDAIRTVPGLYEDYISSLGMNIKKAWIGLTSTYKIEINADEMLPPDSAFTVDRNFICAALARYLNDHFEGSKDFKSLYHTKALFVDGENKEVNVRKIESGDDSVKNVNVNDLRVEYDLLLGCDGIRSVVRNAFITTHRDFEFSLSSTFGTGKSVHIPLPKDVMEPATFMFLNSPLPGAASFVLPETDNVLNVALGYPLNRPIPIDLMSDDPKVVSAYFKKHFKIFDIDCDETAKQWVSQGWNATGQVHCNFYHSLPLQALLLGDAAHATSPQIGQGMNTALADAHVLNELLEQYHDNIEYVLPEFSKLRVKEGNALTDLSFYTFSLSPWQQLSLLMRQNMRDFFHRKLPWLVESHPMSEIPKGMKLSVAYDKMKKLGVMSSVRHVNDAIMRDHFEKETGMVIEEKKYFNPLKKWHLVVSIGSAIIFLKLLKNKN